MATKVMDARPSRATRGGAAVKVLGALRRLMENPDDTTQVFEIMRTLNRPSTRKGYLRLIEKPDGARLAYERTELADKLMDADWLARFAPGTLGAEYREFVTREGLSAEGLATVSKVGLKAHEIDVPDPIAWYGRRIRDTHDLWHMLTGYGRDPLGEACLVAFSFSQTRGRGWLVIALGALAKGGVVPGARGAILEGFARGYRARWLPGFDFERLMAMPIDQARKAIGIAAPPYAYRKVMATLEEQGFVYPAG